LTAELHNLQLRKKIGKAKSLLHSLVPRAQCFCFYDTSRECVWSSDGADDGEVDDFVTGLDDQVIETLAAPADCIHRTLKSGRTVLALPVNDDDQRRLGILVGIFSRNAGKESSFNPVALATILRPALEVIGESLIVGRQLADARRRHGELERELSLVYEVDEKLHGKLRSHAGLAQLVGQSGRYLGISYSVLMIPSKRIRVSATHSSWKNVDRKALDRYLVDHMLPELEGQRLPLVSRVPGIEISNGRAEQDYEALVCPMLDRQGNIEGLLAQLGRPDGRSFTQADKRFMKHIVRKVESVVERSFDAMTGLMNRSGFEAQLQESAKALRNAGDKHQLIYFDLDNLQLVNDTFGRKAGDEVILRFAQMLDQDLPRNAAVSRLAGDEFCMLLTHSGTEAAVDLATRVREAGQALRYLEGDKSLQITMSIGISEFDETAGDGSRALTTARLACDSAKDHGRDRIVVYDEGNLSLIRRHDDMQLVSTIQKAIDADGFELFAQPIASLRSGRAEPRFEILLRMRSGAGDDISTGALLSAAERYYMMPQIDRWVLSRAIGMLAEHGPAIEATGSCFAINLSGQSLSDDHILAFIDNELRESGLAARHLCFEITESAAVSNLAKAQAFIDALARRGSRISLDDFGAGLSSFAYLKNFHVDTLKIDGSFVRDITKNRISVSMVAAITQVAKVMKLETVAEYVETEAAKKLVARMGVHFAQGHAIGRPIPLAEALTTLEPGAEASTA
jgi:diguanylate cyclase (GGDEF)-like protein